MPKLNTKEQKRQISLKSFQILDTLAQEEYDEITELASFICDTPISLVSLVDEERQWFKSIKGLAVSETPRDQAFCAHAIETPDHIMEVYDTFEDDRFKNNPLVTGDPNIRFYAGAPLVTEEGYSIGTLCVIDRKPKKLSNQQKAALKTLSKQVMRLFETKRLGHRYEAFFESSSDLIYELDSDGKYLYINESFKKTLGYDIENLKQTSCWDLVRADKKEEVRLFYIKKILAHEKSTYYDFPIISESGDEVWISQSVDYEYDDKGNIIKIYAIARDITQIREAQEEQDNLIGVIAHDLKSPLNQIYGLTELLQTELTGEGPEYNQMIKKIVKDSRKMIENLVYLKSYEKNNYQPEYETFNTEEFYKQKFKSFEQRAAHKSIKLIGKYKSDKQLINSDVQAINRIVDNLLSNAIKFSKRGSFVVFSLKYFNNKLEILVEDQGPGFTIEDKQKVFSKFQKLSAKPTDGESSTGLGLSIVDTLVQGLGGTINLESEQNKGAIFLINITSKN